MEPPSSTTAADISSIRRSVDESLAKIDLLIESLKLEKEKIRSTIEKRIEELALTRYTTTEQKEELDNFLKEPYVYNSEEGKRILRHQLQGGSTSRLDGSRDKQNLYNIFVVNRFVQWISPIPDALRQKLRFPTELPQLKIVADGVLWTGKEHQEDAFHRYRQFIHSKEGEDRLRIRKGYEFKLISKLVEDGIIPFIPRPVEPSDLREEENQSGAEPLESGATREKRGRNS